MSELCTTEDLMAATEPQALKVSQLVAVLKHSIEGQHRHVKVIGEIASFKQWASGHWYFDIKDEEALIPAVMFKPHAARLAFKVSEGQEILFSGRISVYQANARLQMIVENMQPLGQGALALAFIQLKERLLKEGLFESAHKKNIKILNKTIGIVTSPQGAAIRDMLKIITNRMPKANIVLAPVKVQGACAKEEIVQGIRLLDQGQCDVIIVGRGGGSMEDLWAFNEEVVARAIFAARTPVISAVGHESDTTISDFVADLRAATPTHAAMLASLSLSETLESLQKERAKLKNCLSFAINHQKLLLANEKKRIKDPRVLLFRHWQKLDELTKKLGERAKYKLKSQRLLLEKCASHMQTLAPWRALRLKKEALFLAKGRLINLGLKNKLSSYSLELAALFARLKTKAQTELNHRRNLFMQEIGKLDALSPLAVLRRGFSLVNKHGTKNIVTSVTSLKSNDLVQIRLHDGVVAAKIIDGCNDEQR